MLICHVKHDIYFQEIPSCSIHAFGVSKMNIRSRLFLNRHSFSKKKKPKKHLLSQTGRCASKKLWKHNAN